MVRMINDFIYTEGGLDRAGFLFRFELTGRLIGTLIGTRPVGMGREN